MTAHTKTRYHNENGALIMAKDAISNHDITARQALVDNSLQPVCPFCRIPLCVVRYSSGLLAYRRRKENHKCRECNQSSHGGKKHLASLSRDDDLAQIVRTIAELGSTHSCGRGKHGITNQSDEEPRIPKTATELLEALDNDKLTAFDEIGDYRVGEFVTRWASNKAQKESFPFTAGYTPCTSATGCG